MRGYFAIEALLFTFLLPYLIYISKFDVPVLPRESAELAHDVAQLVSYNFSADDIPCKGFLFWIDGRQFGSCNYTFKYCTRRFVSGKGEVRVCAAVCSRP